MTLRVSATRLKGRDDYYDVLCDGEVVGSIHLRPIAPPPADHGCGRWPAATNATEPQYMVSR